MSLLQDPLKSLGQIDWFLANRQQEQFPGAFAKAAGNLARQTLEQVLFILAFYGGMPKEAYMKNLQLRTAHQVITKLKAVDPLTGKTYLENAKARGPRIRKFAILHRSFDKWRRLFNESSHYRNPALRMWTVERHLTDFRVRLGRVCDRLDVYLVTAAVNEIRSDGAIRAYLGKPPANEPGIMMEIRVTPRMLTLENGKLCLKSAKFNLHVLPIDKEVPLRKSRKDLLVMWGAVGTGIGARFVSEDGRPLDIKNMQEVLGSFARSESGLRRLKRRCRELGITLNIGSPDEVPQNGRDPGA